MRKIAAVFHPSPVDDDAKEIAEFTPAEITVLHPSDQPRKGHLLDELWALRFEVAGGGTWQMPIRERLAERLIDESFVDVGASDDQGK